MYAVIALARASFIAEGTVQMAVDLNLLQRQARYSQWDAEWERICSDRKAALGIAGTPDCLLTSNQP